MKRAAAFAIVAVFVIMAATLGWFLPVAVFNIDDKLTEGKQMDLEVERINLSYRDDLSMAQKINIVNNGYQYDDAIAIDKGIYHQADEIKKIVSDFLADFSGYRFDLKEQFIIEPMLVNLSNNRGTIVIWGIDCYLVEGWNFQCFVDDKTGAILRCSFFGDPEDWGSLVNGYYDLDEPYKDISEKYLNAIYKHYTEKIDAKFITYHEVQDWQDQDMHGYRMIFRDENDDTFEITVNVYLGYGMLDTF